MSKVFKFVLWCAALATCVCSALWMWLLVEDAIFRTPGWNRDFVWELVFKKAFTGYSGFGVILILISTALAVFFAVKGSRAEQAGGPGMRFLVTSLFPFYFSVSVIGFDLAVELINGSFAMGGLFSEDVFIFVLALAVLLMAFGALITSILLIVGIVFRIISHRA